MQRIGSRVFRASRTLMAEADTLKVTFASPTNIILDKSPVYMVSVTTTEGEAAFLAEHAPFISELKPGYVSIYETAATVDPLKYFVPGGFAVVEGDSTASITVTEAIPVEDLDFDAAKRSLAAAEADLAKAGADEVAAAEAQILIDVYSAIINA